MLARVQTSVFFFSVTKIVIFRHIANNIVRLLVKTTLNNKRITKTIKRQQKQHRLFTLLYEGLLSLLSFVLFFDVECCWWPFGKDSQTILASCYFTGTVCKVFSNSCQKGSTVGMKARSMVVCGERNVGPSDTTSRWGYFPRMMEHSNPAWSICIMPSSPFCSF